MRLKSSLLLGGLAWLLSLSLSLPAAAASSPTASAQLDNTTCLGCHDEQKRKIEVLGPKDKPRALHTVASTKYAQSVHAGMRCVACHTDITSTVDNAKVKGQSSVSHVKDPALTVAKVDCAACHQALLEQAKKDGQVKPKLELVAKNIEAYKASFHARPNPDDKTQPNATCDGCHDTHSFNVPAKETAQYNQWRLGIVENCGKSCHEEQLETFAESIHGQELLKKNNLKSAVCTDCHGVHTIKSSSGDPFKLTVTQQCGSCHQDNLKTYKATYHGQISSLGYAYTAKCYDCHGSHKVLKADNPKSMVHANNRMKTCQNCHSGKKELALAPAGFASFQPHGHAGDFKRYPQIWIAWQIMLQLLVGTFGFFWLHTLLWFYREWKERQARSTQPHIKAEAVPAKWQGKHVKRFSAMWRAAHLVFALSLMTLTLTGIPLFYPDAPWAKFLMTALGGPSIAGSIHRVNAMIFAGVFFWHLAYMLWGIARDWKNFKFFGPNSMIPNLQDGRDMLAMFKWFFGQGPRPQFDRWTYWEKFDYWAPFWGVTIIGVSGLVMWFSSFFGTFLPGWVFNVAAIFHAEEAFLAVVFLFTVHFFNNHFRPDKFPLDVVMFTGTFSLESFKHEHAKEYKRLVETGELEQYLVDAPSPAKLSAAKVLGFSLIACGLTLLTLVGIGFFSSL